MAAAVPHAGEGVIFGQQRDRGFRPGSSAWKAVAMPVVPGSLAIPYAQERQSVPRGDGFVNQTPT